MSQQTDKGEISEAAFQKLKKLPILKSRVVTGSMIPIIQIGEEVVIDIGQQDLKRFDIVVVFINNKLICHFLWSKNQIVKPILLQTRAMSKKFDIPISMDNYLGKVVSHKIGFWQRLRLLF